LRENWGQAYSHLLCVNGVKPRSKNTAAIVAIKANLSQSRAGVTLSTVDYGLVPWMGTDSLGRPNAVWSSDSVSGRFLCQRYFICPQPNSGGEKGRW